MGTEVDAGLAAIAASNPSAALGAKVLGSALQGGAAPATSSAVAPYYGMFDSSGWNVNFGSGDLTSSVSKAPAWIAYALGAAVLLVGYKLAKRVI